MNPRPFGPEPNALPGCATLRQIKCAQCSTLLPPKQALFSCWGGAEARLAGKHGLGVRQGGGATTEHSRQFCEAPSFIKREDARDGALILNALDHPVVDIGKEGALRVVGDAKHLDIGSEGVELFADLAGGLAADIGINLVKDQRRHAVVAGEEELHGEHHAGDFAAGGDGREGARGLAGVGRKAEADAVCAGRSGLRQALKGNREVALGEAEGAQFGGNRVREAVGCGTALGGEGLTCAVDPFARGIAIGLGLGDGPLGALEFGQARLGLHAVGQHIGEGRAVASAQTLDLPQARFQLRKGVGIGIDAREALGHRARELLKLRLDAGKFIGPIAGFGEEAGEVAQFALNGLKLLGGGGFAIGEGIGEGIAQGEDFAGIGGLGVALDEFLAIGLGGVDGPEVGDGFG